MAVLLQQVVLQDHLTFSFTVPPGCAAQKHVHSMMLPPPSVMLGMLYFC